MIKKLAWNTFKNTGNINTFLELMEVENVEKDLQKNALNNQINYEKDDSRRNKILKKEKGNKENGKYKNEWNNIV